MAEITGNLVGLGVRPGDVLHSRSAGLFGRAIRRALPGSWGNHDAIMTWSDLRGWCVAEMLPGGFALTPYADYMVDIRRGTAGVVFLRPVGITVCASIRIAERAERLADDPPPYDWLAIIGHAAQVALRASWIRWQREWKWYCTELVAHLYETEGRNVWEKRLPTPYTTEKRVTTGNLTAIAEQGVKTNMRWSEWTRQ
jgi:hypothetical protein